MSKAPVGVIGGSGLYQMEGMEVIEWREVDTPFGKPSDAFAMGRLGERPVVFLSRHGRGHRILPHEINYRANIMGMKLLGVEQIIAVGSVGSLQEDVEPTDIVIPDQFVDRTWGRASTFFGEGMAAHVAFADPVCPDLAGILYESAKAVGARVHFGGTYVCMQGPAFSTRGESELYRRWGMSVIGMTNLQEAKLAREAEICYATMALVTDYDCWNTEHDDVTANMILENLRQNVETAKAIIAQAVPKAPEQRDCICASALATALVTDGKLVPLDTIRKLRPIIGKYLEE